MSVYTRTRSYVQSLGLRHLLVAGALTTSLAVVLAANSWLALLANVLLVLSALLVWQQPAAAAAAADPWVRKPLLLALALLGLQLLLGAGLSWLALPQLAVLVHPGLTTLLLACQLIAALALLVPDERMRYRPGGRAVRQARRYQRMLLGATLAGWLLIVPGHAVSLSGLLALETAVMLGRASLLVAGTLLLLALWQTWRTRRNDRLLIATAGLAAGLLLGQISLAVAATFLSFPVAPHAMQVVPATALWSTLVVLSVLALRRPIPPLAEAAPQQAAQERQPSLLADYISLTKPKVISLLLVTTLAAMFITGEGNPSLALVFWTMLGGYLAAGGAGAINCAFDSDIDLLMGRTGKRPVPSGRIPPRNAFWFGIALGVLAFVVLATFTTLLAAVLAIIGMIYYALVYTRWLKRATWHNIVIGGGAGAMPPLVGWAAVTGSLSLTPVRLFMIIFYWTPPHFWALALVKQKDYARAGVPMLPVVAGEAETRWQILLYSILMFALTLLLTPLQAMGWLYFGLAVLLGWLFLRSAWRVWRVGDQAAIWGLYKFSLLYLALLFAAMVLDRLLLG
jgi:protoheme IX farnesyltransferase